VKRRAMVVVAALVLAGAACGGDGDGAVNEAAVATTEADGAADSSNTDSGDDDDAGRTDSNENNDVITDANIDTAGDATTDATIDAAGDDGSSDDGTLRGQTITRLIDVGLTEDQAICVADGVPDLEEFVRTGESDPTEFLALVEPCAIDLTKLTPPGT
jgi:hypothetical protein